MPVRTIIAHTKALSLPRLPHRTWADTLRFAQNLGGSSHVGVVAAPGDLFRFGKLVRKTVKVGLAMACWVMSVIWLDGTMQAMDWRAEAEVGIAEHRVGPLKITMRDGEGLPLPGVAVRVRLLRHDFLFGTQIGPNRIFADDQVKEPDAVRYREIAAQWFNTVVFGNEHKMAHWQALPRRVAGETALDWVVEQDLALRGHALVWGVLKYRPVLPMPFHAQLNAEEAVDREELGRRIDASILDRCLRLRGRVVQWDVLNEPISEPHLFGALGARTLEERAELVSHWFALARKADPGARLYLNEFGILFTENRRKEDAYFALAEAALAAGAPVDGIGFQGHLWNAGERRSPEGIRATLDRFAGLGLELCVTEFDTYGPWGEEGAEVERAQAEAFEELLMIVYSHPAATGFLVWGLFDGMHWKRSGVFFRSDWSEKPAMEIYRRLVWGEWATQAEGVTDEEGRFVVDGHYGLYAVEFEWEGERHKATAMHHPLGGGWDFSWRHEPEP